MVDIEDAVSKYGVTIDTQHDRIQFLSALEFIEKLNVGPGQTVADIGSGPGHQAKVFKSKGCNVTCIDYLAPTYDLNWVRPNETKGLAFDFIWSHHCLEHIPDPVAALIEWRNLLKPNGRLYLTVPEIGLTMSSGHINSFNLPLLMYQLAMAGFDCSGKQFTKARSHLRAAVIKAENYSPDKDSIMRGLRDLASLGLFPPSVTAAIEKNGRFSAKDMHLDWFGECKAPALMAEEGYDFVTSNLWK